ncbi:MAG: dehypoxanthine futalosine cyclase [Elusimicrobia bacterium RIFCSPLOWO2_02_FULL_39_32]|nr:MAG: dehypoxanthine futalosine cyclase [Elusimicrobia bacterium RIFCSPHIGHO2_02_FULL_39_36]OGR91778.1 MAG: dehypoxanthine futalosine cyclase [Elusimicrobia bacterium RIFCSPLOWO2_02_FULL_39_32]OGR98437.1 MAG: dehypoxanthine futalosine cyclase [Elusimicrobia bacterium RIFCSPLOWO2_12_FULL_39_28]
MKPLTDPSKFKTQKRLTPEEGFELFENLDLLELGSLAEKMRFQKNPNNLVTFVADSNPNYTNVCVTDCSFCAFYRKPGAEDSYTLSLEEVMEKIKNAELKGATTVLLQGGHNPNLPLEYYCALVRETRKRFPKITPHFFTASEIQNMAEVERIPVREVLEKLKEAGQVSLPGGGAEILTERVRKRISPKKGGPEKWLEVHKTAHQIGIKSTATMMYGHIETKEEIVEHLEQIRQLQDETNGFTAFIPWSFKPNHTPLQHKVPHKTFSNDYLRIIAFSRIYLDNFPHIQASWFSEGKKTGQMALHFGADDFGGTIFEENVHRATDHINKTTLEEIITLIQEAHFIPAQRDTLYNILKIHSKE